MNRIHLPAVFLKMALSLLFFFSASSVFSQKALQPLDDWTIQVYNQFRTYEDRLDLSDQSHDFVSGRLDEAGTEWIDIELPAGYTYHILGVCDHDCFDLDLELYTTNNVLLNSDVETDDYPLVSVTPAERAIYRVKVIMANCSSAPCRYGLGVYRSE
jgi:hypothetical protein